MKLPKFKIRASACGKIMGSLNTITDNQLAEMRKLEAKEEVKPLTTPQETKLAGLLVKYEKSINAKPSDKLPETAKTYLKGWIKEQVYERRKDISSKYLAKGNECEEEALNMIMTHYNMPFGYSKNLFRKENEHMTGECDLDIDLLDLIIDSKCSFDFSTFPLFKNELRVNDDYYYQGQVYLDLWKRKNYALCYVLVDTPKSIVDNEVKYKCPAGRYEYDDRIEVERNIRESHKYDKIPMDKRIKRFDFTYDESVIQRIVARVELCREYIKEITGELV